jgi:Domain of unknown function (DUF4132)
MDVLEDIRRLVAGKRDLWASEVGEINQSAMAQLQDSTPEAAIEFTLASLKIIREDRSWLGEVLNRCVSQVLRRKLPFTEDQAVEMIRLVSVEHRSFPFKGVLKVAEGLPMTARLGEALRQLSPSITEYLGGSEMRDLRARIDVLLNGSSPQTELAVGGAWSHAVFTEIAQSPARVAWERVFFHAADLKSSEASQKWRAAAGQLMDEIGRDVFYEAAARWLAMGPSPGRTGAQISSSEAEFQKGFVWFLAGQTDERLPGLLANFAEGSLKKIPMIGAVSQKVGNACVNVLAELPGMEPVSQLSRLAQRVKYDTAQRLIEEALARAAERAGVSRDQLVEMSTPDCGLSPDGALTERFGDYFVRLAIVDTNSVELSWSDAHGKALKSAPAYVKEHHGFEWKDLQKTAKDVEKMLGAHRTRMEQLLLTQRAIPIDTLRSCYLEHPLLSATARRLIWEFESGLGIWHEGRMIDNRERAIDLAAERSARLWHPVASDVGTVLHWRCWLEDRRIRQPFKQAHREVYLITDAERETGTHSNRFAAHILRQHQFAALCGQRGWNFRLMGQWDSHNTPALELPQFGLRVEYEVDFPRDESEVSGHMIYLLIRTGALRFRDARREPQPLESIPPVVFSEVLRDIDLFTGVTSIGADPAWGHREPIPFRDYWLGSSFGELAGMALNRRGILERLLPQLAIRDRCSLDDRALVVRGDRATYRIHLGSGGVLMEPGSRYLCIVEGAATKSAPRNVFLPFDEDRTLSLILSKAFLLAADRKIKDESILRQLPL